MINKQESSHTFYQQWKTVLMLDDLINSDKRNTILNSIYEGQILKEKKKKKKKQQTNKQSEHGFSFLKRCKTSSILTYPGKNSGQNVYIINGVERHRF